MTVLQAFNFAANTASPGYKVHGNKVIPVTYRV